MIVRIVGEGQWALPDEMMGPLNEVDERLKAAVAARDAEVVSEVLTEIRDTVRHAGTPIEDGKARMSNLIVPGPGVGIDEIVGWMDSRPADEGLFPG